MKFTNFEIKDAETFILICGEYEDSWREPKGRYTKDLNKLLEAYKWESGVGLFVFLNTYIHQQSSNWSSNLAIATEIYGEINTKILMKSTIKYWKDRKHSWER